MSCERNCHQQDSDELVILFRRGLRQRGVRVDDWEVLGTRCEFVTRWTPALKSVVVEADVRLHLDCVMRIDWRIAQKSGGDPYAGPVVVVLSVRMQDLRTYVYGLGWERP